MDANLPARLASMSLHQDASGTRASDEPSFQTVGVPAPQSSRETQTEVERSSSWCPVNAVDVEIQCRPVTADKGTAMTDCRTVGLRRVYKNDREIN